MFTPTYDRDYGPWTGHALDPRTPEPDDAASQAVIEALEADDDASLPAATGLTSVDRLLCSLSGSEAATLRSALCAALTPGATLIAAERLRELAPT